MHVEKISLKDSGFYPKILIDYINGNNGLKEFISHGPDIANFEKAIKARKFSREKRVKLFEELISQYKDIPPKEAVLENIQSLVKTNCYTVTTGHQLNIFTGPLYFIYKIITTINTSRALSKEYPEYRFVPVFWMASEDHDFKEISSFRLFGKIYEWETDARGPVGRLNPASIKTLLEKLPEKVPVFEEAYTKFNKLSDSVRYYINELFGNYGLVVLEPDNHAFKAYFRDIMIDDLTKSTADGLIAEASDELAEMGYKIQVTPRAVNLFYMDENGRNRIVKEAGNYKILDTPKEFTREAITEELKNNPGQFSPNVVLRPVYQEVILPNIAYVGGPAEIAYWLQLKGIFDHYKIQFPILLPRNFAMILNKPITSKLEKLDLKFSDLFLGVHELKTKYILEQGGANINLEKEKQILQELFESIKYKAISSDGSLAGLVEAEYTKNLKGFENIEKRIIKSEEKNQETALRQIEQIKEKLFPEGRLQERMDNMLNFYINDPQIIQRLVDILDPMDYRFNIITDEGKS
ncbi:MAG TPA: bacillithiol biosynthesis cysteine-adding enzyme BshC [Cyclobacteriaceae bacterium]|nr:bacillithiol biosynthesis cysteine-adding enzyme BshC [Cyclobacteriaceae bacterium]